jgi:lipoprotein-releasing system ATP-binding protein
MSMTAGANNGQPFYAVSGIRKGFRIGARTIPVLRGVDLEVKDGEFLAIEGASGIGKSTLLHIMGLLERPDEGTVVYKGRVVSELPSSEKAGLRNSEFAFVFQFYHLLPEFTALENVLVPATIRYSRTEFRKRRAAEREMARSLLADVGIGDRLDHRPTQLSGGERQRVAIARALQNHPRIVFCDEPTGNLDTKTKVAIHELLRDLNRKRGVTFVVVTHDAMVAECADRRLHMTDGVIDRAPTAATG